MKTLQEFFRRDLPLYIYFEEEIKNENPKARVAFTAQKIENRLQLLPFLPMEFDTVKYLENIISTETPSHLLTPIKSLTQFANELIPLISDDSLNSLQKDYLAQITSSEINKYILKQNLHIDYSYALKVHTFTLIHFKKTNLDDIVTTALTLEDPSQIKNQKEPLFRELIAMNDYILIGEPSYFDGKLTNGLAYIQLDLSRPIEELIEIVKKAKNDYMENTSFFQAPIKKMYSINPTVFKFEVEDFEEFFYSFRNKKIPQHIKLTTLLYTLDSKILGLKKSKISQYVYEYYNYSHDFNVTPDAIEKSIRTFEKKIDEWIKKLPSI